MIQSNLEKSTMPNIFLYKGHMVIPDYELAHYYGVNTETLSNVFKKYRNLFPGSIVFSVTKSTGRAVSKNVAENINNTLLFTELSATLMAGLLKNSDAVKANMKLLRIFRLLDYIIAA